MKPCKSTRCKTGEPRRLNGNYCSDKCAAAASRRRQLKREQAGVTLKQCPTCGGTGHVATSA